MKNKIVIFKVLAAIIAVGGAFASVSANSSLAVTSAYVRYTTADTSIIYCTLVGSCNHPGANTCLVRVVRDGQSPVNVQAKVTLPPNNNTCPTAIVASNSSASIIATKELPEDATIQ